MKRALITGIGGQDGSYLADILLEKGYAVHGLYRHSSTGNLSRIEHCRDRLVLHQGDSLDATSVSRILKEVQPDEIYHEADQDNVDWSFSAINYSMQLTAAAVGSLLECAQLETPQARVFIPCSAMVFGDCGTCPQTESTPFSPMSPYGCAKAAAYYLARLYRAKGMFVSTAILYNHDSPRRGPDYLLQKICRAAKRIAKHEQQLLSLGNLDAEVDIGYARDYMNAAVDMLQLDKPDDFIIASGASHRIGNLAEEAFRQVGVKSEGRICIDHTFKRLDTTPLRGDISKAKEAFGFRPQTNIRQLIQLILQGKDAL